MPPQPPGTRDALRQRLEAFKQQRQQNGGLERRTTSIKQAPPPPSSSSLKTTVQHRTPTRSKAATPPRTPPLGSRPIRSATPLLQAQVVPETAPAPAGSSKPNVEEVRPMRNEIPKSIRDALSRSRARPTASPTREPTTVNTTHKNTNGYATLRRGEPLVKPKDTSVYNQKTLPRPPAPSTVVSEDYFPLGGQGIRETAQSSSKMLYRVEEDSTSVSRRTSPVREDAPPLLNHHDQTLPRTSERFDTFKRNTNDNRQPPDNRVEELERKLILLQTTLASTKERFQDTQRRQHLERQQLQAQHRREVQQLRDHLKMLESKTPDVDPAQLQLEVTGLKEQLEKAEWELHETRSTLTAIQTEVARVAEEKQRVEEEAMRDLTDLEKELQAEQERRKKAERQKEELQSELGQQQSVWRSEESEFQKQLETYADLVKRLQADQDSWEMESVSRNDTVHALQKELERLKRQKRAAEEDADRNIQELFEMFEETERERDNLRLQLDTLQATAGPKDANGGSDAEDAQLMQFMEVMSNKANTYRREMDRLERENQALLKQLENATSLTFASPRADRNPSFGDSGILQKDLETALEREQRLQTELNGLYVELERISMTSANTDAEKHRLQTSVTQLQQDVATLQERLEEAHIRALGASESDTTPSVLSMRKEMRMQMVQLRHEYDEKVQREMDVRVGIEKELRKMRREREMQAYLKQNESTQTLKSDAWLNEQE